ncbi:MULTISPECIES: BppU family phage baseplate upper protein [Bacillus]|uniref:BppU family phage baseplate upper protein n=1 Tax=Bacillus TaxID=1386 RepID=UPI000CFAB639|nr:MULTISPECIES: BppU family phage baseplate upper protein [Bacillus]PQZ54605.1 hypothetical protein CQZ94_16915 [Bacillus sp. MYb209]
MREEEIIIDLADPVFTKTIRSRQNDKNGLKIIVHLKNKGKSEDLTGYTVKYEAENHTGQFMRDDAQVIDAKNGVFAYTLSAEAVSTSADWTAYFVMEKSTERTSTPDIRISLKRDVKEGNIKIENYISDFEILKKTIDELQKKVDKMDVVKKTGDTMTGHLVLNAPESINLRYDINNVPAFAITGRQTGTDKEIYLYDYTSGAVIMRYNTTLGLLVNTPNTNLLKTAGGTMTGDLKMAGTSMFESLGAGIIQGGGLDAARWRMYQSSNGECTFVPSITPGGSDWNWSKAFRIKPDGTIKQAMDKDWTNLPTTGVENVPDRIPKYKRSGEQITVIGSVKNAVNTTIFATLPAGFRPVQNIAFPALAYGNVPTICEVTAKSDGGIFVNGVQSGNTVHIAMSFSV